MARYLRRFTSERLLRYTLVLPIFAVATFQSAQVFYFTYDLLIIHYGNPIRLAFHDWVGRLPGKTSYLAASVDVSLGLQWIESQPTLTAVVMFGVQGYYAKRLWTVSSVYRFVL